MLHAVIMAGGSGTRFWPASRRDRPKQFLTFFGERSLIQQATDRCLPLADYRQVWIVTARSMPLKPVGSFLKFPLSTS